MHRVTMSFLESLESDMFSLFETINSKANEMTESVKSSLDGLGSDSMMDLFNETNEKVSRMFTSEEEMIARGSSTAVTSSSRNGSHPPSDNLRRACSEPSAPRTSLENGMVAKKQLGHQESVESDLPSFDNEDAPGYAKPTAYLDEREVCRRVTMTTRKLTEADLEETDPLYCTRETREAQGSPSVPVEDGDVGQEIVQCFREQFERLRILLLESFMDLT